MNGLARLWWVVIPAGFARVSRALGLAIADPVFARGSIPTAAFAPPAAIIAGYILAQTMTSYSAVFTGSLFLMSAFVAVGMLSTGLAAYALAGYFVADALPPHHTDLTNPLQHAFALGVTWMVLAALAIGVPFVVRALSRNVVIATAASLGLTYLWTQSAAVLIRPIFPNASAPVDQIAPVQKEGLVVAVVAAVACAVFTLLRPPSNAASPLAKESVAAVARAPSIKLPVLVAALVQAAILTWFLAGLLTTPLDWGLVFGATYIVFALRGGLGSLRWYVSRMNAVPLLLRYIVAIAAAFALSWLILPRLFGTTGESFISLIVPILLSLVVGAFLFPISRRATALLFALAIFAVPHLAFADNCSGLGDCFSAAEWGLIAAAAVAAVALGGFAFAAAAAATADALTAGEVAAAAEAAASTFEAGEAAEAGAVAAEGAEAGEAGAAAAEAAEAGEEVTQIGDGATALGEGDVLGSIENLGLPEFNPEGGMMNCGDVAEAIDDYLGGGEFRPGLGSVDGMSPDVVANDMGGNWSNATNYGDISNYLESSGDGSRGIVLVSDGGDMGHFFNVVNSGGEIIAIDGQSGVYGSLGEVSNFAGWGANPPGVWFLPTWP